MFFKNYTKINAQLHGEKLSITLPVFFDPDSVHFYRQFLAGSTECSTKIQIETDPN